jgi:hypothetical protein
MLKVQLSPRRVKFVDVQPDNGINKGGYYCRVYEDENGQSECDSFTIDKRAFPPSMTDTDRRRRAIKLADERVKQMFK